MELFSVFLWCLAVSSPGEQVMESEALFYVTQREGAEVSMRRYLFNKDVPDSSAAEILLFHGDVVRSLSFAQNPP